MDRVRKAFRYADTEGKGFLTRHQYKIAMTVVFGYCPDRSDVDHMFGNSSNPKNTITFQQFHNSVKRKINSARDLLDSEYLFTCLDKKFKGYLISKDFLSAAKDVNLRIPAVTLENAFKELDCNKSGYIGMDEFASMMVLEDKK